MKKLIYLLAGFAILLLSNCQKIEEKAAFIKNEAEIDSIINHFVENGAYPFTYVHLEDKDGKVLYQHAAIDEEMLPDTKIDEHTWIRIWSMSKIITISLALDLIEEGVLNLEDPVTKYIPEFENLKVALSSEGKSLTEYDWGNRDLACPIQLVEQEQEMTVSHLINHKAGFYYAVTSYPCIDSIMALQNLPTAKNTDEAIARLAQLPLIQQPGTDHFYGTNTTVLGFVAERATGKSLKQLVKERITDPLNIEGLQYGLPSGASILPRFSGADSLVREAHKGELDIFGPDVPDYDPNHELYLGGEGMLGTADAYADFLRYVFLHKGTSGDYRFLNEATIDEITTPRTQLDNPWGSNGYNLWITGDTMRTLEYGEEGLWTGGGYESTQFWVDPNREYVAIIMSQMYAIPPRGYNRDNLIRGAMYKQFWEEEQ